MDMHVHRFAKKHGLASRRTPLALAFGLCLAFRAWSFEPPRSVEIPLPNGDFSQGLTRWDVDASSAPMGPTGTVSVVGGAARLAKGASYRVRLSQTFDAPNGLRALRLRLADMPVLTGSGDFIPDAFDVHLTDDRGFTRVASIRAGASASVNASGSSGGLVLGAGATLQGDELRIAIEPLEAGTSLRVSIALVGPAAETLSTVAVDDVVLEAEAAGPPGVFAPGICTMFWDGFEDGYPAPPQALCYEGQVNDSGLQQCADGSGTGFGIGCPVAAAPGQDAEFGRDALAAQGLLNKRGSGEAGFDFTKLDAQGHPLPRDASQWSCVVDNSTGLVWENKSGDPENLHYHGHTYSWFDPDNSRNGGDPGAVGAGACSGSVCDTESYIEAVNAEVYCGANVWRLPTRAELQTLIHSGRTGPSIDVSLFPQTPAVGFWTASPVARDGGDAWVVLFADGTVTTMPAAEPQRVRLVRVLPGSAHPLSGDRP